jgi:DNA mismatch endonuclease (patch repair protein)
MSRSENMSRVRSRDTSIERAVRSGLHKAGFRFRLHVPNLPGSPDIVLPKYSTVIFVHGCFWHQHARCPRAKRPSTNRSFWDKKLDTNVSRDKQVMRALQEQGWRVMVLWQCELNEADWLDGLAARIINR